MKFRCWNRLGSGRSSKIAVTRKQFFSNVAFGSAAFTSAFLSGCVLKPAPPLRVGAIVWPAFECLFLAERIGIFNDQPIKPVEYPSTPEAIRAFRNRAIEVIALTGDEFLRL